MKKLKFAIVGCGRIAHRHAEHISNQGELIAVCDVDKNKVNYFSEKYKATPFLSLSNLLSDSLDVDVITICTPNGVHAEQAIAILNAGYHVLCEKPMATNVYNCGQMIQAAEKSNKRLFIVKQNRFNPPVQEIMKLIKEGVLGKIYSVQLNCFWNRNDGYYNDSDWKGSKELDGGTLFTQFSHFIDLLYWMIGDVKSVYALTENFNHQNIIDFEDAGVVALQFYSGAIGTINYTVNSNSKNMEGSITIFGEKGTVKIGGEYLNELEYQNIDNYEIKNLPLGNPPNNYGKYVGSMSNHGNVYENVTDVLTNRGVISTNMFEGLKTVEIIEKIYTSAKKNKA